MLTISHFTGGETAEMPGMYHGKDFDLAGFSVGAVDRKAVLPRLKEISEGDVLIGLPSSGVHSNGFSLVRKIIEKQGMSFNDKAPFDLSQTLGQILLAPTRIYVRSVLPAVKLGYIVAASHITGGGLTENIPRVLPSHLAAELDATQWVMSPVFKWLKESGSLLDDEMLRTFNCGLGMILVIKQENVNSTLNLLKINGEPEAKVVGKIVKRSDLPVIVKSFSNLMNSPSNGIGPGTAKRVAVLISGSGTNLQALIDHAKQSKFVKIVLVISNKPGVAGLTRAENAGIKTLVIPSKGYKNRVDYDMVVNEALKKSSIEIVCLAGFMRILSEEFVHLWKGRMLNVHPALLPSFKGMDTHARALEAGVRIHGCTVHFVEPEVDTGAIVLQEAVPVLPGDTPEILQERVKLSEHKIFPLALEYLASGHVELDLDGKVRWNKI